MLIHLIHPRCIFSRIIPGVFFTQIFATFRMFHTLSASAFYMRFKLALDCSRAFFATSLYILIHHKASTLEAI